MDDGLIFDPFSVTARQIKEGADYEGVRVSFLDYLEKARIPTQLDIVFREAVTPPAVETTFPTILDGPAAILLIIPGRRLWQRSSRRMMKLGIANSRMKDFHDLSALSQLFSFEGKLLSEATRRTFEQRKTSLPSEPPFVFSAEFFEDKSKQLQWAAFNGKNQLYIEAVPLKTVVGDIEQFLMPLVLGLTTQGHWSRFWQAGGPWKD